MKEAETWVVLLQLSREVGEIDPCNVLVSHGSIRCCGESIELIAIFISDVGVIRSGVAPRFFEVSPFDWVHITG